MSENYTWREELKTNFSVNFDNLPPSVFPFSKLPLLNPRAQMSRISGDAPERDGTTIEKSDCKSQAVKRLNFKVFEFIPTS